ncbi:MAG: sigma 54-interacting transcriptional regulator [Myxococcales bacterium]|nr:sigma 54-interacting transcriptional regulator [Myxococcales bacterium]
MAALRDARSGAEIPLIDDRRYVVGKGESCDIALVDPCVSRVHCVLERRGGVWFVRDSGSRNGTFINDRRIESAELTPGTVLTVGLTNLVALGPPTRVRTGFDRLLGRDPTLRGAVELASRAAGTDCSVLILGETGTGKEVVAQAIHETSRRAAGPFVALNCGAIPRELIGSELFGHERGAFTGAVGDRAGVFVQATAAPCSSTSSASCRSSSSRTCCARSRPAGCGRSAASASWPATPGSSPRPTAMAGWAPSAARCGSICSTAWRPWWCGCRRCARAPAISTSWSGRSSRSWAASTGRGGCRRARAARSASTPGRATCASCARRCCGR